MAGDKFHFIEAKKISLYEEGKKTDKKDGIKVTIVTEENPNRIYQSQSEWNIGMMYQVTNYMIQLILKI